MWDIPDDFFRGLKRETKSYRDAQIKSDEQRVKELRRAQFKKSKGWR